MTHAEPTALSPSPVTTIKPPPSTQPETRTDMYGPVHKALRFLLANLLVKAGQTRWAVASEASATLDDLDVVIAICDEHIEHEDTFVRPALVERASAATATLDAEHGEHAQQVAELRALAATLRAAASPDAANATGKTLYLHFSVFVAETLAHMAFEERVVQPLLDRLFTPAELHAIHDALLASIPPPEMMRFLGAMVPSSNRDERVALLSMVKTTAPPEAFAGLMAQLRGQLPSSDFADLADRIA